MKTQRTACVIEGVTAVAGILDQTIKVATKGTGLAAANANIRQSPHRFDFGPPSAFVGFAPEHIIA